MAHDERVARRDLITCCLQAILNFNVDVLCHNSFIKVSLSLSAMLIPSKVVARASESSPACTNIFKDDCGGGLFVGLLH